MSEIIRLVSRPAKVPCSIFLYHVRWDQVFVHTASNWSPDPPLGLFLQCVYQSGPNCPWNDRNLLIVFVCNGTGLRCRSMACSLKSVTAPWRPLKQQMYLIDVWRGQHLSPLSLRNGLTTQVGCSFFTHSNDRLAKYMSNYKGTKRIKDGPLTMRSSHTLFKSNTFRRLS